MDCLKVAYAQKVSDNRDILKLFYSPDCGNTWQLRATRSGSILATVSPQPNTPFTPTSDSEWEEYSYSLPQAMLSEGFQFKFEFTSKGGNNIYIDDINISGNYRNNPILFLPEDSTTNVGISPILDWKSVDTASFYVLQVDTSASFTSTLLQEHQQNFIENNPFNTDTEKQLAGLIPDVNYFWRVLTVTGQDTSNWSDVWLFETTEFIPILGSTSKRRWT